MLGSEEWVLADVVAEHEEAPGIRSFDLVPRGIFYPEANPGQHIVVEGLVSGMRVRRPYTLSSPAAHGGRLRITVKREEHGAFSPRITRPRGENQKKARSALEAFWQTRKSLKRSHMR
jgi:ferredoxin-NADP reductase